MTSEYQRGLLRAIEIASLYADENIRMATDTVSCDPILNEDLRCRIANVTELARAREVSDRLQFEGADHASKHHAGLDIVELIKMEMRAK